MDLSNASNTLSSIATSGSIGSLDLVNSSALQIAPVTVGSVTRTGIQSAGAVNLSNAGDLTLAPGAAIQTSNGALVVQAGRFLNQAGVNALHAGGSNVWQVWSLNPAPYDASTGDLTGNLPHDFVQYNASLGQTAIQGSGKGLFYQFAPALTIDVIGLVSKVYDANTDAALARGNYRVAYQTRPDAFGVNGDVLTLHQFDRGIYASNGTGTAAGDAGSSKTVAVSGLGITAVDARGKPVYGYSAPTTASAAVGEILPKILDLTIEKVYDGNAVFDNRARSIRFTGMVAGEPEPSISSGSASVTATPLGQSAAPVGQYLGFANPQGLVLDNPNYTIIRGTELGRVDATIAKAPLGVTVEGNYSGTTEIIKPTAFTTTGLVNGETLTALSKFTVKFREVSANDVNYVTELFSGGGTAVLSNYELTLVPNKLPGDTQNTVKIKALSDIIVSLPKWTSQDVKPAPSSAAATSTQTTSATTSATTTVASVAAAPSEAAPSAPAAVQATAAAPAAPAAAAEAAPAPSPAASASAAPDGAANATPAASAASQGDTTTTAPAATSSSGGSSTTEEANADGKPRPAANAPDAPAQAAGRAPAPAQVTPVRPAVAAGVSVAVVTQATAQVSGLVNVVVPPPVVRGAAPLVVALPTSVVPPTAPSTGVRATLTNDRPLPTWIKYDATQKALIVESTPATALPVTVVLSIGGQRTSVVVSESAVLGR